MLQRSLSGDDSDGGSYSILSKIFSLLPMYWLTTVPMHCLFTASYSEMIGYDGHHILCVT